MMKNQNRIYSGLLLSIAPLALSCQTPLQLPELNVLVISVDDLRPALRCYGDPLAITPNIDRLSSQGVLFNHHYVQAPSCAPSRTSMLTGLRPDEVQVTDHKIHFRDTRPDVVTLPQYFKQSGYTAISLGKIFHYSSGYNDSESWHEEEFLKGGRNYVLKENLEAKGKAASSECEEVPDDAYTDGQIAGRAVEYLNDFSRTGKPFFLAVGFLKPHLPFNAPKKYWDLYNREDFSNISYRERTVNAPDIAYHQWQELRGYLDVPEEGPITAEKEKELRHGYYACVSFIDAQVGKVLEALDKLGMRENTIIVLWGDHGFHLGEQNLWCKSTNYELAARSPMMISVQGMPKAGKKCNAMVESVDLYPTILDLCGFEIHEELSGVSLKPLLDNPAKKWKNYAFNQFARPYRAAIGAREPKTHMGYSVRTEEYRYTAWYNLNTGVWEFPELYSFSNDEFLNENLAGKPGHEKTEGKLKKLVEGYRLGKY